ncbi:MAG: TRAP transporter large permease subunit [Oscillospiraceae bacterium]|nr:TRAP transporter large permease subunit [Oscillospiraceae bacterium]
MKTIVIALFALTYVLMLSVPKYRHFTALAVAGIYVVLGVVAAPEALAAVDWNVILMLAGTMGTVHLCIESQMPAAVADILVNKLKKVKLIFVALAIFSGVVSAFIDNVATVLMVAPIALAIAKKFNISPVQTVLTVAVSSNLQGAATLVGDTTSILLGGYANMDFMDFFFMDGKLGMFWIVQAGMLATVPVLFYIFRKETQVIERGEVTKITNIFPTVTLLATVACLIGASFIPEKPHITNGVICMVFCVITIAQEYWVNCDKNKIKDTVANIDFQTLMLLSGLFIIIQGITNVGLINDISNLFVSISGDDVFLIYTILVWFSVIVSAFIDNIPYVATMLPVVSTISATVGIDPTVLYFGLLAGATLGGNITPVGASANIAAGGILRREGCEVSTKEFMKIGVPFTLVAVITGYILIWMIHA